MIHIELAQTGPALDEVRTLMREFLAWHRERHVSDLHLVERYFDAVAFEAELAGLPGPYAPPAGGLLLARWQGGAAGCVALKPLAEGGCEMKRMFVRPALQGHGTGRALATRLLEEARRAGHAWMQLDTSIRQKEAAGLYRSLGFRDVPAPAGLDAPLREWLVFMRLDLRAGR
jgi:GNAT superfamily N-acetyltransferase